FAAVDVSKSRKHNCPCCGEHIFGCLDSTLEEETIQTLCGRNSVQITPVRPSAISLQAWAEKLRPLGILEQNPFLLKLRLPDGITLVLFPDGRMVVQGTDDPVLAKSLYS